MQEIICSFIAGHPEDTEETIVDTVEFANKLRSIGATTMPVSMLIPFPGSDIWIKRKEYGITIFADDWKDFGFEKCIIGTKTLPRERIESIYCGFVLPFLNPERTMQISESYEGMPGPGAPSRAIPMPSAKPVKMKN